MTRLTGLAGERQDSYCRQKGILSVQFNSFEYLFFFLPIVVTLYAIFRTSIISKYIIFAASCIFYGWVHPWFLIPMFGSAFVDYFVAQKIHDTKEDRKRNLAVDQHHLQPDLDVLFQIHRMGHAGIDEFRTLDRCHDRYGTDSCSTAAWRFVLHLRDDFLHN